MTKLFLDTEFTGLHKNTTIISLALVSECGRSFYAEFTDFDRSQIDDWLRENVLNHLWVNASKSMTYVALPDIRDGDVYHVGIKDEIRDSLAQWLESFGDTVEIWSDCLAWDWVLFCDLWGHAFNVPKYVYPFPFDIMTLFKVLDIGPDTNRDQFAGLGDAKKHNALHDAMVIRACYFRLMAIADQKIKPVPMV